MENMVENHIVNVLPEQRGQAGNGPKADTTLRVLVSFPSTINHWVGGEYYYEVRVPPPPSSDLQSEHTR